MTKFYFPKSRKDFDEIQSCYTLRQLVQIHNELQGYFGHDERKVRSITARYSAILAVQVLLDRYDAEQVAA